MKPLIKAALIASLLVAAPAWAGGGSHRGWDGPPNRHHWKHGHHKPHYHKHRWHPRHARRVERVEHVYRYYEPYPVQSASASPGIHVIFPDVYFPWPK